MGFLFPLPFFLSLIGLHEVCSGVHTAAQQQQQQQRWRRQEEPS